MDFALKSANLIFLDEIGKMELFSKIFIKKVTMILDSNTFFIGTMGIRINHPFIEGIKSRNDIEFLQLNRGNQDKILNYLTNKIEVALEFGET